MLRAELQEVLREGGIYLAEYRALARLKDRQMTMGALAEALGLTPASMTDLTRQLVARGWIVRGRSPTDRRVYLVEATADGLRAHRTSRTEYQRRLLQIDRAIPPGARQGLSDGLRELIKVLDTRRRARGPVAP